MSLAWISVAALVLAVTLSCTTTINVGVLSLAFALIVGVLLGDMSTAAVLDGFPVDLFVTLVGVTLLFAIAEVNGTLARVTERAVRLCRGHAGALPIMFFAIGFVVATIGAGATPASALLAPPAMAVAARAGVPPLLMAIMAGNGALAGTLSPFAPTGIVAHSNMERIGLGGVRVATFTYNALAHTLVGFGGFLLLGGWKLFRRGAARADAAEVEKAEPMTTQHWLTAAGIAALIVAVAGFGQNVGMVALIVSSALILLAHGRGVEGHRAHAVGRDRHGDGRDGAHRAAAGDRRPGADHDRHREPVDAGHDRADRRRSASGLVSVYSSTSGVVLPAFLPMVPDLAMRLGGLDPLPIAWSMNVAASLVDLSSLSTGGALFIAGAAGFADTRKLFNQLLAWGLSMSVVGAVLCYILFA